MNLLGGEDNKLKLFSQAFVDLRKVNKVVHDASSSLVIAVA
jgi:hypothetical protein